MAERRRSEWGGVVVAIGLLVGLADAASVAWYAAAEGALGWDRTGDVLWLLATSLSLHGALAVAGLLVCLPLPLPGAGRAFLAATGLIGLPLVVLVNTTEAEPAGALETGALLRTGLAVIGAAVLAASVIVATGRRAGRGRIGMRLWGTVSVLALATWLLWPSASRSASNGPPNVLVIGIDTLRADHLGAYGYPRATSPNIDRLAAEGVRYARCLSPDSSTAASHASLWTGRYPHGHGVLGNGFTLGPGVDTLAEVLSGRGYETVGFTTNQMIDARKGFAQGFRRYMTTGTETLLHRPSFAQSPRFQWIHSLKLVMLRDKLVPNSLVTQAALDYLRRDARGPFFLFVQYLDPHAPYEPAERFAAPLRRRPGRADGSMDGIGRLRRNGAPITAEQAEGLEDLYDGEIRQVDEEVGRLLRALDESGLAKDTLVVLWADHGENMANAHELPWRTDELRNVFGHGYQLYDALVHVPLIVRWPERLPAGRVVTTPVSTTQVRDLIVRLLDAGGAPGDVLEPDRAEPIFGEIIPLDVQSYSIQRGAWKLIRYERGATDRREELYDVERDPAEQRNLLGAEPEVAAQLQGILERWVSTHSRSLVGRKVGSSVDDETMRQLRALGYVH